MRLKIGGKEFELKPLNLNDWIEAEDLGIDMARLRREDIRFRDLRALAFVAVKKVDSTITLEWIGENLGLDDMEVIKDLTNFISPKGTAAVANT